MAIKVGEVYVEVFPRINAAARKAAIAGISNAFRDSFNDVDKQSSESANRQNRDTDRVRNHTRTSVRETSGFWSIFHGGLQRDTKKSETFVHKLATKFRTFGTLLRGLSLGTAVIGGLRLVAVAIQGIIALMPVVQTALLAIPFAIGAIVVETAVLKIAFKGVGKAIGLAFDPTKAKQYQAALEALSPSARRFVQNIAKAAPVLKGLQENLFAAPALQRASARFGSFMRGLQGPLNHLAKVNGNLIGRILGTFTDSKGLQLSVKFVNALGKIIRGVTPGLVALTRAFQVLAVRVAVLVARHVGGINDVLEKLARWLTRIDVKTPFERAISIIKQLKPAAVNIWQIFQGIVRAFGGWKGSSKDFITSVTDFTGKVAKYVNSKAGQNFLKTLQDTLKALSSITGSGLLVVIQELSITMQILLPLLQGLAGWAANSPGSFKAVALAIGLVVLGWKAIQAAILLTNVAMAIYDGLLAIAAVLALPVYAVALLIVGAIAAILIVVAALAAGVYFLIKYWATIWGGIMQITVWASRGIQKLVEWMTTFFTVMLPRAMISLYHWTLKIWNWIWGAISTAGKNIVRVALAIGHWFSVSLPHFFYVAYQWIVHWFQAALSWFAGPFKNTFIRIGAAIGHWFTVSFTHFFYVAYQWILHWFWAAVQWFAGPFKNFWIRVATAIGHWFTTSFPHFFYVAYQWVIHWFWTAYLWFYNTFVVNFKKVATTLGNWFKTTFVGFFRTGWNTAIGVFNTAVQTIWKAMKRFGNDTMAGPWNWVAKHIFNEGIFKAWNAVAGILGLTGFKVHLVDNIHFASGGHVRGPGGPKDDKIPAMLSAGEFVVNAAATKANMALLWAINGGAKFAKGGVAHLAGGGVAWPYIVQFAKHIGAMAGLHITSTTGGGHAPHSYHYSGQAVDISGGAAAMNAAAAKLMGYARYMYEMFHSPSWFVKNGKRSGPIDKATHYNHIHIAMSKANAIAALHGSPAGAGIAGDVPAIIAKIFGFIKKGTTYFSDPITKLIKAGVKGGGLGPPPGKNGKPGGFVRSVLELGVPKLLAKGASIITDKVGSFVANAAKAIGGFFSSLFKGGKGGPTFFNESFNKAVAALAKAGFGGNYASWLPYITQIARKESNFNPNAINRSDSNARRGDPSRGFMQVIGSTFRANHVPGTSLNIYDPVANIASAMLYIKKKYGAPWHTPWFTGRGTYYAEGGAVGPLKHPQIPSMPRKIFDNGGPLPPGFTMAYNGTGSTEWVGKGGAEGTVVKELHVHVADKHFVAQIDDRIARHDTDLIQFIARH